MNRFNLLSIMLMVHGNQQDQDFYPKKTIAPYEIMQGFYKSYNMFPIGVNRRIYELSQDPLVQPPISQDVTVARRVSEQVAALLDKVQNYKRS